MHSTIQLRLFGKTPAHFKEHYKTNYNKDRTRNTNINKKRNPPTYKKLIERFIQYEENGKLDKAAYINLSTSIFPRQTSEPARKFNDLLQFAAGDDGKIDIYEWLIINYLFEKVKYTEFVKIKLNKQKQNYEKFVNEVRRDEMFMELIQTNYEELSKKKAQFTPPTLTPVRPAPPPPRAQQEVQEKIKEFKRQINDNFKSIKDNIKPLLVYKNINTNIQGQEVLQNLQDSVIKENIIKMIVLSKNLDEIKKIINNSDLILPIFYNKDNYNEKLNNDEIYKVIKNKIMGFNNNNLQNRKIVINDICKILIKKINYYKDFINDLKDDVNICNEIDIDQQKHHRRSIKITSSVPTTHIIIDENNKLKILDKNKIENHLNE